MNQYSFTALSLWVNRAGQEDTSQQEESLKDSEFCIVVIKKNNPNIKWRDCKCYILILKYCPISYFNIKKIIL